MKKRILQKIAGLLSAVILVISLCSCRKESSFSMNDFNKHENTITRTYSFLINDNSDALVVDREKISEFRELLAGSEVFYGYEELFNYEQALLGIQVDHSVANHKYSALDDNGYLTKEYLFDIVRINNTAYLTGMTSLIKDIDDEFLMRICEIVVDTVNDTLSAYPDIDKDRVYCNLGNLKVVEKSSALDFAAVEPGMVLHVNRNTSNMVGLFTSSNMYSVLVHESMHIIQYGCECEGIDGCVRRCGLAHSYSASSMEQDYSDWIWLAEGSAERMACLYSNVEPMTYTNPVNYILSLDLATMLKEDVPANYVETLYFYSDVDKLFSLFGAETDAQKQEVYKMIYALEMMQMEPADVKESYKNIYGTDWTDEVRDDLNNRVKRPIVQTLTKTFLRNLADAMENKSLSKNDLMFLLNLYESTINYHLRLNMSEYDTYNAEFVKWYRSIREALFACFENITLEEYSQYIASDGVSIINTGMKWLAQEKQQFLIEKFESNKCDYKFI